MFDVRRCSGPQGAPAVSVPWLEVWAADHLPLVELIAATTGKRNAGSTPDIERTIVRKCFNQAVSSGLSAAHVARMS